MSKVLRKKSVSDLKEIYKVDYVTISDFCLDKVEVDCILNTHRKYLLEEYGVIVDLEGKDEDYKYNPKKLSKEIYGTPDLWSTILILNGISTDSEFSIEGVDIYVLNTAGINSMIRFASVL